MHSSFVKGSYAGKNSQRLTVRLAKPPQEKNIHVNINGKPAEFNLKDGWISILIPPATLESPSLFEIKQ